MADITVNDAKAKYIELKGEPKADLGYRLTSHSVEDIGTPLSSKNALKVQQNITPPTKLNT